MFDDYMMNATNGGKYDFKFSGDGTKRYDTSEFHRGMPIGTNAKGFTVFASARDVGNIAAGYIAATNGLSWADARLGFDLYQSIKSEKLTKEGTTTIMAEYYGWRLGYNNLYSDQKSLNFEESGHSALRAVWQWIFNRILREK